MELSTSLPGSATALRESDEGSRAVDSSRNGVSIVLYLPNSRSRLIREKGTNAQCGVERETIVFCRSRRLSYLLDIYPPSPPAFLSINSTHLFDGGRYEEPNGFESFIFNVYVVESVRATCVCALSRVDRPLPFATARTVPIPVSVPCRWSPLFGARTFLQPNKRACLAIF